MSQEMLILKILYSPVDGYRCTSTEVAAASRRRRPQCSMAAATAGPMSIRKVAWWQQVRCGTVAAGPSVFERGTAEESLHNVQ